MNITDTHCHLNDPSFENRIDEVIERANEVGVTDFIVPAYDMESLERTARFAERYSNIHPAYGIHPWYIRKDFIISDLLPYLDDGAPVAVGEIGLDFAEDVTTPRELQKRVFVEHIELAISHNLPVLIHCRRAHNDMLEILKPFAGRVRGIMHSFSGSKEMMMEFLNMGFFISFSGAVTRSHAKKYHKNAISVPENRILFETDAPSISTQRVEAKDVEPCHIIEIIEFVSKLRDVDSRTLINASLENVIRLFGERLGNR